MQVQVESARSDAQTSRKKIKGVNDELLEGGKADCWRDLE
jgi:hypothetical protein